MPSRSAPEHLQAAEYKKQCVNCAEIVSIVAAYCSNCGDEL